MERQLTEEYSLLKNSGLHTETDILDFIDSRSGEIEQLEKERQVVRNSNRRPRSPEERQAKNAAAREISRKIKPLRRELKLAEAALQHYPQVWRLLQAEHETERTAQNRIKERGR